MKSIAYGFKRRTWGENKIRIETELANGELAQEKNVPFDVHFSFDLIASRCSSRFNFPEREPPSEKQFLRLVKAGIALNTEQARISYKYVSGFYQSVCNALSPETVKRLGALNSRMRNARQLLQQNSSEPDMAHLIKIANESTSISEVTNALGIMSPFLIVKPVSYLLLWQQPYMRAGSAMPSRADRVNSKTIELVGLLFYCKNRPDECMSGKYFTVLSCESYYVCAPGLDVNSYLAMQHSQDRLLAANQIADALIAQRRTQIRCRPQK